MQGAGDMVCQEVSETPFLKLINEDLFIKLAICRQNSYRACQWSHGRSKAGNLYLYYPRGWVQLGRGSHL